MFEMTILDEMYQEDEAKRLLEKASAPPTVKDVLLERWAQDTVAMAEFLTTNVQIDCEGFCKAHETGCDNDCKKHMIAYLNSAAEVEA